MTAAKHTPGPWQLRDADPTQVCDSDGDVRGCAPIASCDYGTIRERKANASLIAAAPDLLEALEPFAAFACSPPGECLCPNCKARAAIAKARGEA